LFASLPLSTDHPFLLPQTSTTHTSTVSFFPCTRSRSLSTDQLQQIFFLLRSLPQQPNGSSQQTTAARPTIQPPLSSSAAASHSSFLLNQRPARRNAGRIALPVAHGSSPTRKRLLSAPHRSPQAPADPPASTAIRLHQTCHRQKEQM
jgi:hypothetical protein